MKKIRIYAYTKLNLGDDLFIKILCERYPNTQFLLYAPKIYKELFKDITNLKCYSSESIVNRGVNAVFRKFGTNNIVEKCISKISDGGVYIGGSLFIQGDDWKEYTEKYIKPMNENRKPFYLLGANFGPYKDKEYFDIHKKIFKGYTDICFREKYTYDMFKNLPNVRMADDIIFGIKGINTKEENSAVISVIKPSYRQALKEDDEVYYEKIKDICIKFIEENTKVTLMSFCKAEGDEEAIEMIMELLPIEYKEKVNIHYYNTNINETVQIIAKSKYVIASRFHAMILGFVFDKAVLPLVYSSKMTNVMDDIRFKGQYIEIKNIKNLDISKVIRSMDDNYINVDMQIKSAEIHFKRLDKFLIRES